MAHHNLTAILHRHRRTIYGTMGIVLLVVLIFTFIQPRQYRATTRLLIIQKEGPALDAYSALKSSERIGMSLSQLIETSSFFADVVLRNPSFGQSFSDDATVRRRQWQRTVDARVTAGTGILAIETYHRQNDQALLLADAVAATVQQRAAQFWSGSVQTQIVDFPVVSKYPARPNIPLNIVAALFFGALLSGVIIVIRER
ncbi:MAG: hypothetical protein Q7S89_01750 [bacterium]|nr:hypothetical protein [bacterium]